MATASQLTATLLVVGGPTRRFAGGGGAHHGRLRALRSFVATDRRLRGRQPVRLLPDNRSSVNWSSQPSSVGMSPVRLLPLRFSVVSPNSCPTAGGIVPPRLWLARFRPVTRVGVPLVVTPVQLVRAVPVAQLRVAVPRRVSLAASRVSQSLTSCRLAAGLGMTVPLAQVGAAGGWAGVKVVACPSPGVMSA